MDTSANSASPSAASTSSENALGLGDSPQFAEFYKQHYPLVFSICIRRLSSRAIAEDVASEAFMITWKKRGSEVGLSAAWLLAIVRNLIGNQYRNESRDREKCLRYAQESRIAGDPSEVVEEVRSALNALRPTDRCLLYMVYWENCSANEVAETLGSTAPAVWTRLSRAREHFRKIFHEDHPVPQKENELL